MHIERVDLADARRIHACDEAFLAAQRADCPDEPPLTGSVFRGWLTVGWGGDPREVWLAPGRAGGAAGWYRLELPERENRDRAYLDVVVHPAERRHGLGTTLLRHAAARTAEHGRSVLSGMARDGTPGEGFARWSGAEPGVVEIQRVLELGKLADDRLAGLRDQAEQAAAGYSLVSWTGPVPEESIEQAAALYAALNDAPHSPGEEPAVWNERRVRESDARRPAYGTRDYTVAARHDASGELAALSEMIVDPAHPGWGHQGVTAVTRKHRGHRLGLLVKVAMLQWLATSEPQLEQVATWNGKSNAHMIAINEALGYTILGPPVTSWLLDVAAARGGTADRVGLAG
jgi:GNAT superfamily N-acetyltransferase/RimJ/RimL family protein N-acetyltransferase